MKEKRGTPPTAGKRAVYTVLHHRFRTTSDPETQSSIRRTFQDLDAEGRTDFVVALFEGVAEQTYPTKRRGFLDALRIVAQEEANMDTGEIADSVITVLEHFRTRYPGSRQRARIADINEATDIIVSKIPDEEALQQRFAKAREQVNEKIVYNRREKGIRDDEESGIVNFYLQLFREHPGYSISTLAAITGLTTLAVIKYLRKGGVNQEEIDKRAKQVSNEVTVNVLEKIVFRRKNGKLSYHPEHIRGRMSVFLHVLTTTNKSIADIAREYGLPEPTVYGWYKKLVGQGKVPDDKIRYVPKSKDK